MLRDVASFFPGVNPDVIVLNLGTNAGPTTDYRALVARLQALAPNATIVLGTLTPRAPELATRQITDAGRLAMNATIRALGNESSTDRIVTADVTERMFTQQNVSSTDFSDDTHLSVAGGAKFGRALLPEVAAAVARAGRC
jgi:lysophospholipase L1-like esterase